MILSAGTIFSARFFNLGKRKGGKPMASVFISYRRADCAHAAGRLKDHLVASLGDENVFFDVDAIGAGEDFHRKIEETLAQCDAVLVMIGENWNPATSEENTRELDDPEDWVRIEAAKALAASKKVIPILVDGTKIPEGAELPEDLAGLTKLNGVPLRSGGDFTRDSEKILDAIGRSRSHRRLVLTISIAAVLILSGVVFKFAPWENGDPVVPPTMSELIMEGMTPPDPGAGEVDLITNERLVGEK
jgi:hypothetical protein